MKSTKKSNDVMDHFNCPECGEVPMVLLDAYAVFDRQGEGVLFEIRIFDGMFVATPDADAARYLKSIRANVKAWSKDMVQYAEEVMEFTCPKCGEDVYHGCY